jgi:hypothetical protein
VRDRMPRINETENIACLKYINQVEAGWEKIDPNVSQNLMESMPRRVETKN